MPRTSSSGLRDKIRKINESISKSNYSMAVSNVNDMEDLIENYYVSRGEKNIDIVKLIREIRGWLRRNEGKRARDKLRKMVRILSDRKKDPRESLSDLRLEFEQAISDLDEGKIDSEECASICREALDNMRDLKEEFIELDKNGYNGIYDMYEEVMESVGRVRSNIFELVKNEKARGSSSEKNVSDMEEKIEKTINYEPEVMDLNDRMESIVERAKEEGELDKLKDIVDEERSEETEEGGMVFSEGDSQTVSPGELEDMINEAE